MRRLEKKMIEIGRICVKTAGRDAGLKCVIVDVLDNKFVLIDGETRRRKCNILHLELLKDTVKIKKNISHESVKKVICDISKIKKSIDWEPKVSINEGLKKTLEYYKSVIPQKK